MKNLSEIITAIEACTAPGYMECERCAYNGLHDCQTAMDLDALEALKKYRALRSYIQDKKQKAV